MIKNRINLICLSRTGHHVVADWLRSQIPESEFLDVEHWDLEKASEECEAEWEIWNLENVSVCRGEEVSREQDVEGENLFLVGIRDYRNWLASFYAMHCRFITNHLKLKDRVDGEWLLAYPDILKRMEKTIRGGTDVWVEHLDCDHPKVVFHKLLVDQEYRDRKISELGFKPKPYKNTERRSHSDMDGIIHGNMEAFQNDPGKIEVTKRYEQLAGDILFDRWLEEYDYVVVESIERLGI